MEKQTCIYFLGIGGIGMSALALLLNSQGHIVAGCDSDLYQESIKRLAQHGIRVHDEQEVTVYLHAHPPAFIVYISSMNETHPGIQYAKQQGIPYLTRAQLLEQILHKYKTIGITGAHGKTSTTALTSTVFLHAKTNPTIFVGGFMQEINSNFAIGTSELCIVEADDAYKSFLTIFPHTSLVTSISLEHLETYRDINDILETFSTYVHQTHIDGHIILNSDTQLMHALQERMNRPYLTYAFCERADFSAREVSISAHGSSCIVHEHGTRIDKMYLPQVGKHHVSNALGAYAIARQYHIEPSLILEALEKYQGVKRRFEHCGTYKGTPVFDDYGHHPTELETVLKAARLLCSGKLIVFFQPHKYSRTYFLWNDFLNVLSTSQIDELYITDIFAAGEEPRQGVDALSFTKALCIAGNNACYVPFDPSYSNLINALTDIKELDHKSMILCLGAGKLNDFAQHIVQ